MGHINLMLLLTMNGLLMQSQFYLKFRIYINILSIDLIIKSILNQHDFPLMLI